jgi:hypothetical protein
MVLPAKKNSMSRTKLEKNKALFSTSGTSFRAHRPIRVKLPEFDQIE